MNTTPQIDVECLVSPEAQNRVSGGKSNKEELCQSLEHQSCKYLLKMKWLPINCCFSLETGAITSRVYLLVVYVYPELSTLLGLNKCFHFRHPLEIRAAESLHWFEQGGTGGGLELERCPLTLPEASSETTGSCQNPRLGAL